jgi:hypothetical protein
MKKTKFLLLRYIHKALNLCKLFATPSPDFESLRRYFWNGHTFKSTRVWIDEQNVFIGTQIKLEEPEFFKINKKCILWVWTDLLWSRRFLAQSPAFPEYQLEARFLKRLIGIMTHHNSENVSQFKMKMYVFVKICIILLVVSNSWLIVCNVYQGRCLDTKFLSSFRVTRRVCAKIRPKYNSTQYLSV